MSPTGTPRRTANADDDFAARIRRNGRALRAAFSRRETWSDFIRQTLGQTEPAGIARVVIDRLAQWIPAPGWAVAVVDSHGQLSKLVEAGVDGSMSGAILGIGAWVVQQATPFMSADLSKDARLAAAPPATIVALPLSCGGRTIGTVISVDPRPSARAPEFESGIVELLREVLDAAALAIDQGLRLQRAEAMSVTDELTGLYNSRFLREALHREAKRAMRYGRTVSVLFIDLDGFKTVNDTYGHLSGSRTLVEAGAVIRGSARESDIVARYGGDEFVVVLPDTGSEGGLVVARRIRERIAAKHFLESDGLDCRLTASVGVATLPDMAKSSEELLDASDRAMYHVKQHGKNNICLASRL